MKFNFKPGITATLALILVAFAAFLLAGLSSLSYFSGRQALQSATESELLSTVAEKEAALNAWIIDGESDLITLSQSPSLKNNIIALQEISASHATQRSDIYNRVIDELRSLSRTNQNLASLTVIAPDSGQVIAATRPNEMGVSQKDQPFFIYGKQGPYIQNIYTSPTQQGLAMTVAAPLRAEDGTLIGVLASDLNLSEMNEIVSRRSKLHQTDDTFLVNSDHLLVSPPRFITDPAILQNGIHTEDVNQCLTHQNGLSLTEDYRGMPVISAYRWLPYRELCLVVKLDQAEAFGPIYSFGLTVLLISLASLALASLVAVVLARTIVRPLHTIQQGVVRFGQGDLDTRLPENFGNELDVLAHEFNQMANVLVEEQTYLRRRTERFFSLALDLLCTFDPESFFKDLNPAWENTLGYTQKELIRHRLFDFVHPDDLVMTIQQLQGLLQAATVVRFENRIRHKDGSYLWLAWVATGSPDEQLIYAAARDITARRQTEEKLKQQTEELARSNKELEQFAYVASHDLQEPLRMVSSYVQLIARRYQGKLDQEADEFIAFAVEGANRMKTLINDLLAFSRVGTRGKELAPLSLETVLDRTLVNLRIVIEESGSSITHDPLPEVIGDSGQMVQLFQNLIGNAIKFHGQAMPRIHVSARRQDEFWLLAVQDNGIGIDPQFSERIFTIFQRLHNRDEYEGTGIGLAICRKIVERHGGRIWVESQPGQGATFLFTLLAATQAEPTEPEPVSMVPAEPSPAQSAIVQRIDDLT